MEYFAVRELLLGLDQLSFNGFGAYPFLVQPAAIVADFNYNTVDSIGRCNILQLNQNRSVRNAAYCKNQGAYQSAEA